jgi:hypothetical protein
MTVKKKANHKPAEPKSKASTRENAKKAAKNKAMTGSASKAGAYSKVRTPEPVRVVNKISPPRNQNGEERKSLRVLRAALPYTYMKAPGALHDFRVGDKVEVFCDHEKGRERVRGWIAGIVVQVDNKLVAVQFRSNVYLTDGWMVPDRILWYPLNSEHIRPAPGRKTARREKAIPDY